MQDYLEDCARVWDRVHLVYCLTFDTSQQRVNSLIPASIIVGPGIFGKRGDSWCNGFVFHLKFWSRLWLSCLVWVAGVLFDWTVANISTNPFFSQSVQRRHQYKAHVVELVKCDPCCMIIDKGSWLNFFIHCCLWDSHGKSVRYELDLFLITSYYCHCVILLLHICKDLKDCVCVSQ